jgi:hypothetical protein
MQQAVPSVTGEVPRGQPQHEHRERGIDEGEGCPVLANAVQSTRHQTRGGPVGATALRTAGIDLAAYAHADRNLSHALSSQQVALRFLEQGPAGVPVVVASGHWLAAATLVASGLRDRVARLLGDDIVAAVPHRDLLLLFDAAAGAAMRALVEAEFQAAAKPLTSGLFAVGDDGPSPLR